MYKVDQIVQAIRESFMKRMQRKTGWGKNEIQIEFECAISEALSKFIESKLEKIEKP